MNQTSLSHKLARENGKIFEELISASCEYYRRAGQAEIEKTPEPRTVVGRTGGRNSQMLCVNAKKAQPDYKGTLSGGKSVVFEAKHTDSGRIQYGALTPTQLQTLDRHEKLGAECFVLVSFSFRTYARIPFFVWREMAERYGRKYILEAEAKPYQVRLAGILEFLEER